MTRRTKPLAPRVHQPPKEPILFRLPGELLARVKAIAKEQGISRTELVTRTLSKNLRSEAEGSPPAQAIGGASSAVIEQLVGQIRTIERTYLRIEQMNLDLRKASAERKAENESLQKGLATALAARSKAINAHTSNMMLALIETMGADMEPIHANVGPAYGRLERGELKPHASETTQTPAAQPQQPRTQLTSPIAALPAPTRVTSPQQRSAQAAKSRTTQERRS